MVQKTFYTLVIASVCGQLICPSWGVADYDKIVDQLKSFSTGTYYVPDLPILIDEKIELDKFAKGVSTGALSQAYDDYTSAKISDIQKKMEQQRKNIERDYNFDAALIQSANLTLEVGKSALEPLSPSSIGLSAASSFISSQFNAGLDALKANKDAYLAKALSEHFKEIPTAAQFRTKQEQDAWWRAHGEPVLMSDFKDQIRNMAQTEEEQTQIEKDLSDELQSEVFAQGKKLDSTLAKTVKNEKSIRELIVSKEIIKVNIKNLARDQENIRGALINLAQRVERIDPNNPYASAEVTSIKEIIAYNGDPKELLTEINKKNSRLHFSDDETKQKALNFLEFRNVVVNDIGGVIHTTESIGFIAKGLGIDPGLSKAIDTGVNAAKALSGIAMNMASGNYLAAGMAVVGMLMGPGPDPEQMRFEAIMNKLNIIDKKLTAVLENQQKMMDVLADLDKKMNLVLSKLDIIDNHIDEVKDIERYLVESNVGLHECFFIRKKRDEFLSEHKSQRIPSFQVYQNTFSQVKRIKPTTNSFTECLLGLDEALSGNGNPGSDNPFIALKYDKNASTPVVDLYDEVYALFANLMNKQDASGKNLSEVFNFMVSPATFTDIFNRDTEFSRFEEKEPKLIGGVPTMLSPGKVKVYVDYLLENSVYNLLVSLDGQGHETLHSPQEILRIAKTQDIAEKKKDVVRYLHHALDTVNTAIAQQSLLSGDYLLKLLPGAFNDDHLAPAAAEILDKDSLIYQNWVKYFVISRLRTDATLNWHYGFGLEHKNRAAVAEALAPLPKGVTVELVTNLASKDPDGKDIPEFQYLALTAPNVKNKVALPSILEVTPMVRENSPLLTYSQEMESLMTLKKRVVDAILSYTAFDSKLTKEEIDLVIRLRKNQI